MRPLARPGGKGSGTTRRCGSTTTHARGVYEDFTVDDPAIVAEIRRACVEGMPLAIRLRRGSWTAAAGQQVSACERGRCSRRTSSSPSSIWLRFGRVALLVACRRCRGSSTCARSTMPVRVAPDRRTSGGAGCCGHSRTSAPAGPPVAVEGRGRLLVLRRLPRRNARPCASGAQRRWSVPVSRGRVRRAPRSGGDRRAAGGRVGRPGGRHRCRPGPVREVPRRSRLALRACLALRPVIEARGPLFVGLELLDSGLAAVRAILGSESTPAAPGLVMRAAELRRAGRVTAALADLDRASSSRGGGRISTAPRSVTWSSADRCSTTALRRSGRRARARGPDHGRGRRSGPPRDRCGCARFPCIWAPGATTTRRSSCSTRPSCCGARGDVHGGAHARLARVVHRRKGRYDDACALYQESIRTLRRVGAPGLESRARADLGLIDIHLDRHRDAEDALLEAVNLARWIGDRRAESNALRHLGLLGVILGDLDKARERLLEALAIRRDRGDGRGGNRYRVRGLAITSRITRTRARVVPPGDSSCWRRRGGPNCSRCSRRGRRHSTPSGWIRCRRGRCSRPPLLKHAEVAISRSARRCCSSGVDST